MHGDLVMIGILEESKNRITFKLLKDMLIKLNYKIIYENYHKNIGILNKKNKIVMIVDMNPNDMEYIDHIGLDFHILIHTFLKSSDYQKSSLKNIIKRVENIIVNCDEEGWTYLIENNKKPIVITYGFNSKSTINPSSYNIQYAIKANICFQREIITIMGNKIEPFEIRMKINSIKKENLYSGMAVLACSLVLGIDSLSLEDLIEFEIDPL